jgi:hypothetical protein
MKKVKVEEITLPSGLKVKVQHPTLEEVISAMKLSSDKLKAGLKYEEDLLKKLTREKDRILKLIESCEENIRNYKAELSETACGGEKIGPWCVGCGYDVKEKCKLYNKEAKL